MWRRTRNWPADKVPPRTIIQRQQKPCHASTPKTQCASQLFTRPGIPSTHVTRQRATAAPLAKAALLYAFSCGRTAGFSRCKHTRACERHTAQRAKRGPCGRQKFYVLHRSWKAESCFSGPVDFLTASGKACNCGRLMRGLGGFCRPRYKASCKLLAGRVTKATYTGERWDNLFSIVPYAWSETAGQRGVESLLSRVNYRLWKIASLEVRPRRWLMKRAWNTNERRCCFERFNGKPYAQLYWE